MPPLIPTIVDDLRTVARHVQANDTYGPLAQQTATHVLHTVDVPALRKMLSWVFFMESHQKRHQTAARKRRSLTITPEEQHVYLAAVRLEDVLNIIEQNQQAIARALAA